MQKKKSRFWLFVWSLIPGAGEMYLGFMKMGVSLMLGFAVLIMVTAVTNLGMLGVFPMVMYVYCFFHANNLGTLSDEEFYAVQDQYFFGLDGLNSIEKMQVELSRKYRKIAAVILIVIGLVMLWDQIFSWLLEAFGGDNYYLSRVSYFIHNEFFRIVFAVVVIWIGCRLIRGRKAEYIEDEDAAGKQNVSSVQDDISGQTESSVQGDTSGKTVSNMQDSVSGQYVSSEQDRTDGQIVSEVQGTAAEQNVSDVQDNVNEG